MANRKSFLAVVLCLLSIVALAQDLKQNLFQAGFEQVHVLEKQDSVIIFFEHRSFRNPFHSFQYGRKILGEQEERVVTWVPMYNNKLMGTYNGEHLRFNAINAEKQAFFKEHTRSSQGYRFHFRIVPDFHGRFGRFDRPLETKTNIILDSRIYLLSGLTVQSGILFPIQNSLDAQQESIRLAPSHLHFFHQWHSSFFLALTAGTFYNDRYGFDLQVRYAPFASRWSVGVEGGYTGFYYIDEGVFYKERVKDLLMIGDFEYRLPISDLSVKLSAGQYLFRDKGARAEVIRQFGGVDVGFFAARTQRGSTAGFQLAFSFFPGKIIRTNKIELRTTEEFRWEYSYSNRPVARKYRLGIPRLSDQLRQYNALFVQSQSR